MITLQDEQERVLWREVAVAAVGSAATYRVEIGGVTIVGPAGIADAVVLAYRERRNVSAVTLKPTVDP